MHRVSPNNPVRRRLLFDDDSENRDARNDNLVNLYREIIETEQELKKKKWNYDFKNDKPLEGKIQWIPDGKDSWIGVVGKEKEEEEIIKERTEIEEVDSEDKPEDPLQMNNENEVTPKSNKTRTAPLVRKRRSVEGVHVEVVKRKISLD